LSPPRNELLVHKISALSGELFGHQKLPIRDELFGPKISSDVLLKTLDLACHYATPTPQVVSLFSREDNPNEFNTFDDVLKLFQPPNVFPTPKVIQGIYISHNYVISCRFYCDITCEIFAEKFATDLLSFWQESF
jgi:hypothetical protein